MLDELDRAIRTDSRRKCEAINRTALRILHQKLNFIGTVSRTYADAPVAPFTPPGKYTVSQQ